MPGGEIADEVRQKLLQHSEREWFGKVDAGEQHMHRKFLTEFRPSLFPFAVESEWRFPCGLGDLVFADKPGVRYGETHDPATVLCVELKYLDRAASGRTACTKRRQKRRGVEEQIGKAVQAWQCAHPGDTVYGIAITNEFSGQVIECSGEPKLYVPSLPQDWLEPTRLVSPFSFAGSFAHLLSTSF